MRDRTICSENKNTSFAWLKLTDGFGCVKHVLVVTQLSV
jgi:hypothetical protein